jgi:5'-nucleotidase
VGGAARFVTLVNSYRDGNEYAGQPELVTLFSGDAFNPSIESSVTKVRICPRWGFVDDGGQGRHMVPILRDAIKVDVACCGNHGP